MQMTVLLSSVIVNALSAYLQASISATMSCALQQLGASGSCCCVSSVRDLPVSQS